MLLEPLYQGEAQSDGPQVPPLHGRLEPWSPTSVGESGQGVCITSQHRMGKARKASTPKSIPEYCLLQLLLHDIILDFELIVL